ncbi:hypothetical protein D3C81_2140450 [compost metagenome]
MLPCVVRHAVSASRAASAFCSASRTDSSLTLSLSATPFLFIELTNSSASPISARDRVAASSGEYALTRKTSICSSALNDTCTAF